ncbi:DUF4097 family beta strand repeat-containing protein [Solibacillus sp. FSL R7-0682]|uniref:DUF4097 family beta strand repeat-containing protein n=1 Tax=Solibacillus sp. FSL R7-0682 TaxID=2921690 RepID=UPI0030F8E786
MNEKQFLDLLDNQLMKLQQNERNDIRRDFEEYFENGRAEGKTTEEIIEALGSIEEIAEELMAAYDEKDFTDAISLSDAQSAVPYQHIRADVDDVNFSIVPTDAQNAFIEVKDKENLTDATMVIENDTLVVKARRREKTFRFLFIFVKGTFNSANVVLHLPRKQYERMTITSGNGSIKVMNAEVRHVNIEADNGRIVLENLIGETVRAESDNGRIVLSNVNVQNVKAKTDNGRIVIEHCTTDDMELETDNGRIEAELEKATHPIELKTDNGRIMLSSPGKLEDVTILTNTSWGSVSIYDEKTTSYESGTKEHTIKLKTSNGRIVVADSSAVTV